MADRRRLLQTVLAASGPSVYTISGTVYDADGTTAVASATVALGAYNATSAANGTYTISNIPAGTSGSMTCTKTGYSWTAKTISAMAANLTSQNYTNTWWASGGIAASCLAAWQPRGAASLAASKVNLANPGTYDAAAGTNPSFATATGWTFTAASSQYLTTGLVNGSGYSMLIRFSGATVGTATLAGCLTDASTRLHIIYRTLNNDMNWGNGGNLTVAPVMQSGVAAVAGNKAYRDGVADAGVMGAWSGTATVPLVIGALMTAPFQRMQARLLLRLLYITPLSTRHR